MKKDIPAMKLSRLQTLDELSEGTLDLLVIGGGIVGAGIARDAAMRGLRTGLVEQQDFAYGTSSRSSRLLHGGLRYLAQGRVGLVREASVEKRIIHHIAPHLAEPLPFLFPTYRGNRNWPLWQLKIGVKLYDALCGWRNLGRSQWLSADAVLERQPRLNHAGLNGAVRYFDGLTNDARLVLDTLRSAAEHGALLANRMRFTASHRDADRWRCEVLDTTSDTPHRLRARWIVNAAGPWANRQPHGNIQLRLTKGVHLVIDRAKLPMNDAVVMTEGRRILFAIPWGQRIILGTTDTDYHGDPGAVRCEQPDVEYLLGVVNRAFPAAALAPEDVLSAWAGLRPLVADQKGHPSDASRSHVIRVSDDHWLDVAGGKLTTYRLIAEQTVDKILHLERRGAAPCQTASEPLLTTDPAEPFSAIVPPPLSAAAVEHYCRNEWAMTLEDVMIRRTSWHYYLSDPAEAAQQVVRWMADPLDWDQQRIDHELRQYLPHVGVVCRADPHDSAYTGITAHTHSLETT
jgi:glycerol-3-phosphate dehydrogenase